MDFSRDPELEQIRVEAEKLASAFDDDYWSAHDEAHEFPWEFYEAFAKGGWMGVVIPTEYGGAGLGLCHACTLLAAVAGSAGAMNAASSLHLSIWGMGPVIHHGSEELKQRYLPPTARGFVTSGHATERDWQIGYRYRNGSFRSKAGQLYGLDTQGRKFPINSPNPKVYLPIGNCLMGNINGKDAMALAWMQSLGHLAGRPNPVAPLTVPLTGLD